MRLFHLSVLVSYCIYLSAFVGHPIIEYSWLKQAGAHLYYFDDDPILQLFIEPTSCEYYLFNFTFEATHLKRLTEQYPGNFEQQIFQYLDDHFTWLVDDQIQVLTLETVNASGRFIHAKCTLPISTEAIKLNIYSTAMNHWEDDEQMPIYLKFGEKVQSYHINKEDSQLTIIL